MNAVKLESAKTRRLVRRMGIECQRGEKGGIV